MDFLLNVYPVMTAQLQANTRSHAFDGNWIIVLNKII